MTEISEEAFNFCTSLKNLKMSDGVTKIGGSAFQHCESLGEATLPDGLEHIGEYAFNYCSSLKSIAIPSSATEIGEAAFAHNALLKSATLGDGATCVVQYMFYDCPALESVVLPDSVSVIGTRAFYSCRDMTDIALPKGLTTVEYEAFALCSALTDVELPDGLTTIGEGALDGLTGLKKLVIQCDPAIIPAGVFANLPALSDVTVAVGAIPAHMFEGSGVTTLALGEGVTEIGESAFAGTKLNTADLQNAVVIGAGAFAGTMLNTVDLQNVSVIGAGAFEGAALERVTLRSDVNVGERAFADTKLAHLVIPEKGSFPLSAVEGTNVELRLSADATDEQVAAWNETLARPWYDPILREGEATKFAKMPFEPTAAENFDFDPETGLISAYTGTDVDVVVPREIDGVTVVGFANYNAFDSCHDYTDSSVETNRTEWVHLRTLVLPETIRELPDMMLGYCQQLETFVCYAPLESTGSSQFVLCRSLNNVIFVNGVRMIDNYAFDSAGPLGNLYFGEHLISIGQQAFGFSGLKTFVADAENVEYGAFAECQSLTSLHFTDKVKMFGENCIVNCPKLAEVCFDGCDLTASPAGLMMNVAPKLTVHVPEGMSEENLKRAQKCVSWNSSPVEVTVVTDACAHTRPEAPDLSALLPELKLEAGAEIAAPAQANGEPAKPEITPEPEATAAPEATAEPEAAPEPAAQSADIPEEYQGTWYGLNMELDGETYPLADLGLDVTVTIGADGTAEMNMGGDVDHRQCAMQDGALVAGTMVFTLRDGVLSLSEDGAMMTLSREKPEAAGTSIPVIDESATLEEIKGVWTVVRVTMDGLTLPAETADMAGDTLVVYGDTCDLTLQGMTLDGLPCRMEGYSLLVSIIEGDASITLREDGTLILESVDIALQYERAGDAPDTLDGEATPEPTAEPAHEPAVTGTEIMLENKYVLIDADVNGYNMTAAMLGNYEYSVLLHQDGTVDFVMAGADIPGLVWTYGKVPTDAGELDGVIIDYYGQPLYLVPTDSGFDMDYFDSMRMHFAPEGSAQ